MRDKVVAERAKHSNKRHSENTWNNNIVETSSINQFRNDNISVSSHQSAKRSQTNRSNNKKSKATKLVIVKRNPEIGFGFSIRGGVEHGTGIFISGINKYSDAHKQGLQVGDQILRANKYNFEGITHEVAVEFIQHHKALRLLVLSLGIIPGTKVEHTQYQWIDCYGRTCSPLLNTHHATRGLNNSNDSNESNGIRLLEEDDERKVNIVVGDNHRLGLLIRGGYEYGLGVFVAGIDVDSVADRLGIMVGEQILEVNGIDFSNISHADAAHIIRTSKMMTMILKDVEKIPLARIVLDHTEWIDKNHVRTRSVSGTSNELSPRAGYSKNSVIQLGIAGSQLHHQSATGPTSYQWIEEKAHSVLMEDEWTTLQYYIREYVQRNITVNGLVLSLLDLMDTKEKRFLIPEVRGIVRGQDINTFDEMVLRIEVEEIKADNDNESHHESLLESDGETDHDNGTYRETDHNSESEHDNDIPEYKGKGKGKVIRIAHEPIVQSHHIEDVELDNPDIEEEDDFKTDYSYAGSKNFKYKTFEDETYNSTVENITEESILERSPNKSSPSTSNKTQTLNIMDSDIPEEEHVYAKVNKRNKRNKYSSMLKEYEKQEEETPLNTFNSPPSAVKNKRNEQEEHDSEDETDFEKNKLGFAFNFLNKDDDTEEIEEIENYKTAADEYHAKYEEIKPSFSQKDRLGSDDDDGSVVSVSSLENGYNATPPHVANQTKSVKLFQNFNANGDVKNRRQRAEVVDIDFEIQKDNNSIQNFQPKVLTRTRASFENDESQKPHLTLQKPTPLLPRKESSNETNFTSSFSDRKGYFERKQSNESTGSHSNESNRSPSPDFNSASSFDHRVQNFSVNDIMRQSFLPTTRLDYDPLNSPTKNYDNNSNNNENKSLSLSLNSVSALNIQNQYQYEKSRTPSFESIPMKLEEIKNYGKPVMAKSPRPNYLPSSSRGDSLYRKIQTTEADEPDERNEGRDFNLPKLRKTKNSDIYINQESKEFAPNTINERQGYPINTHSSIAENRTKDIDFRSLQNDPPNKIKLFRQGRVNDVLSGTDTNVKIDERTVVDSLNDKFRITRKSNTNVETYKTDRVTTDIDLRGFQNNRENTTKFYRETVNITGGFPRNENRASTTNVQSRLPSELFQTEHQAVKTKLSSELFPTKHQGVRTKLSSELFPTELKAVRTKLSNELIQKEDQAVRPRSSSELFQTDYEVRTELSSELFPTEHQTIRTKLSSELFPTEHQVVRPRLSSKLSVVETDLRANDNENTISRNKTNLSENLKARIDVFNVSKTKQNDNSKTEYIYANNVKAPVGNQPKELPGRTVIIPRNSDHPGFTLDVQGENNNRELFVSEIQDPPVEGLQIGDVIIGINGTFFKKGLQKGLANLMLRNGFNNNENNDVILHLKS